MYKRLPFEQYFSDQSLGEWGGKPRFEVNYKEVKYNNKDTAFYCIMFDEIRDVYQIYFKETCTKRQWLVDFDFPTKYYDSFQYNGKDIQLKVARGWGKMYAALKWYIRRELQELIVNYGLKEIEIIGWSLGSALAQLCAQDLYFNFNLKAHVFTFGSVKPWYGKNKAMREYLKDCYKECYNFYDWNDIVGYMVCLPGYFALNRIIIKQDKKSFWKLFNPYKYHTEYFKADYYKQIG